jgi:hypothetical protein
MEDRPKVIATIKVSENLKQLIREYEEKAAELEGLRKKIEAVINEGAIVKVPNVIQFKRN